MKRPRLPLLNCAMKTPGFSVFSNERSSRLATLTPVSLTVRASNSEATSCACFTAEPRGSCDWPMMANVSSVNRSTASSKSDSTTSAFSIRWRFSFSKIVGGGSAWNRPVPMNTAPVICPMTGC